MTLQRWHIAYFIWCWFPTDDKCSNANLLNVRYQIDLSWSICFYPALLTVDHHTIDWIDEVVVWSWMWPGSPDWFCVVFLFWTRTLLVGTAFNCAHHNCIKPTRQLQMTCQKRGEVKWENKREGGPAGLVGTTTTPHWLWDLASLGWVCLEGSQGSRARRLGRQRVIVFGDLADFQVGTVEIFLTGVFWDDKPRVCRVECGFVDCGMGLERLSDSLSIFGLRSGCSVTPSKLSNGSSPNLGWFSGWTRPGRFLTLSPGLSSGGLLLWALPLEFTCPCSELPAVPLPSRTPSQPLPSSYSSDMW